MDNTTTSYVHTDHLGSVVAESNSAGQITKRFHYKPFGETLETQQDDVGYTGHKHDSDLGLTYMQARYYDPVLGRFYGNDPVGYVAKNPVHSFNRYAYANNNPYKYIDPDGKNGVIPRMSQMNALASSSQQTPQSVRAAIFAEEHKAQASFKAMSLHADTLSVVAIATGQAQAAIPLSVVSATASVVADSIDFTSDQDLTKKSNEATLVEGAGYAAGKAAENGVTAAGEVVGTLGFKGKVVERVIDVAAEATSQSVSDTLKDDYLKD
ncbi:RHS repeat-associated core domain-containing protein [Cellvibrio fontiphilus]|uniref:RHS repeat-associated core domain-containing protein n=1 Tax=Cellvibrio fontiphilus TaxID=1815559 RepID=A0ABV7FHK9_9GAMM